MPPVPGVGFAAPAQGIPSATIDFTEGSQKRGSQECVTDQSKSNKKRRGHWKKTDIVELDDAKEEVELLKNIGHWKDHWGIQIISIWGDMLNTFSAPPKQGTLRFCFFVFVFVGGGDVIGFVFYFGICFPLLHAYLWLAETTAIIVLSGHMCLNSGWMKQSA